MKHPLSRALGALLLLPLLLACGDDEDPTGPGGLAGTYALVEVNGEDVPAPIYEEESDGFVIALVAEEGSLRLTDDTYTAELTLSLWVDGEPIPGQTETDETTGSYTVSGSTIRLEDPEGDTLVGTVSGDRITFVIEDDEIPGDQFTLVFEK